MENRDSDYFFAPESRREIGKQHQFPERRHCPLSLSRDW
jgi:hypothetical protein